MIFADIFDQIACFHMCGLCVRSHMTAGQDGFRNVSSKHVNDLVEDHRDNRSVSRLVDRSHHLLFSCKFTASAEHGSTLFRLPVMAHLLCGLCLSLCKAVRLTAHHQLPGDTGDLVGQRHCDQLWLLALQQANKPGRRMLTSACPDMLKKGRDAYYQNASQHLIASTGRNP